MTSELKSCPMCDGKILDQFSVGKNGRLVTCRDCGSGAPVKTWNNRPIETELIEALKDMIEAHNYAFPDVDSLEHAQEKALSRANSIIQKAEGK